MTVTGTRMLRKEDPELLSGEARFVDDLPITGALWLGMVRSSCAHARIGTIDTSAAEAMPGVRAVYTGAQLVELGMGPLPCAWAVTACASTMAAGGAAVEDDSPVTVVAS